MVKSPPTKRAALPSCPTAAIARTALIDTFVIPLRNCDAPELAPINILRK